jgi:hypothetical protein
VFLGLRAGWRRGKRRVGRFDVLPGYLRNVDTWAALAGVVLLIVSIHR